MEQRGKQELWARTKPEVLRTLRDEALVHSVESSNRIEGVTVSTDRLRPLVIGNARPRDRSEHEIAGYRRALTWIFKPRRALIAMDSRTIRHLHALSQSDEAHDAGSWKTRDNEIIEITPAGRRVRFVPTPAKHTQAAIVDLCRAYDELSRSSAPALLIVATVVFDFLCIHPFRDGNGRVSRLLTTLLLERHGFVLPRFVSLERLVEESKEDYYRVLAECSREWAEGKNLIVPGGTTSSPSSGAATSSSSRRWNPAQIEPPRRTSCVPRPCVTSAPFTLAELIAAVPGVGPDLVKKTLQDLRKEGRLALTGRGRSASWHVIDPG